MKASFIVVVSGAASVMAGPLVKRAMTTTTTIETVYTTITLGDEPSSTSIEALPTGDAKSDVVVESFPTGGTSPDVGGPDSGYVYGSSVVQPQPTTTSTPEVVVVTSSTPEEPSTTEGSVSEQTTASTTTPAETATSASGSSGSLSSAAVYHHNVHRSNHSAPSMSWGEDYASYASALAGTCDFHHDTTIGGGGYGQNIAMWAGSSDPQDSVETFLARSITEMWYNGEIDLFPSDGYGQASPDQSNFESWGHYTQVIWEGSTVVGCAVEYCKGKGSFSADMGGYFSVCNYYPAGNVFGAFNTNVKAPAGEATVNV